MPDEKLAKSNQVIVSTTEPSDTGSQTAKDVERAAPSPRLSKWQYLQQDVDPAECTWPLTAFCFMTGFTDAVCFSAIFVWCGFQTGNFTQLALALARLWEGPRGMRDYMFHKADQQALCSLLAFFLGSSLGRIGDKVGPHKRSWLIVANFLATLFTMAAALALWKSGQPSLALERDLPAWTNALTFVGIAFMSAALGIQGIMGKRIASNFGTTLVLTTLWIELINDPKLFRINLVKTRDHRALGAFALFFGAFVSRAMLFKIDAAGALGVGVGIRLLMTIGWLWVPAKKPARK
ncbi:hypothetical protein CPB83DRAFT_818969 [Crepidotus variabilis]|uniref:DUF1275 domain protein n=1 Tax=Crepidotus variabilis TaxID=179855 RepID=A0A9P6EAD4_9AGAR|nr:hypothetical protein CPB83DRAFT_818969 [Crepidotus variabilis]